MGCVRRYGVCQPRGGAWAGGPDAPRIRPRTPTPLALPVDGWRGPTRGARPENGCVTAAATHAHGSRGGLISRSARSPTRFVGFRAKPLIMAPDCPGSACPAQDRHFRALIAGWTTLGALDRRSSGRPATMIEASARSRARFARFRAETLITAGSAASGGAARPLGRPWPALAAAQRGGPAHCAALPEALEAGVGVGTRHTRFPPAHPVSFGAHRRWVA
jgi:hypothetical protein